MGNKPLISVIVPCYNVEKYLDDCIESIITQTYSNLEIILVDDGSPDRVPEICDRWALKDPRIIVIHKKNGGLSDARNCGLNIATGDFIAFVDSDDFIEPTIYEDLLSLHNNYHSDVTCCQINRFVDSVKVPITKFSYKKTYETEEYIRNLLLRRIDCASWNKLYTKEFIDTSRFIVGRNNEDIIWLFYRFYGKKFNVAYTEKRLYNYRVTPGSITKKKINVHSFDAYINAKEMMAFDMLNDSRYLKELRFLRLHSALYEYLKIIESKSIQKYHRQSVELYNDLFCNKFFILFNNNFSLKEKVKFIYLLLIHNE